MSHNIPFSRMTLLSQISLKINQQAMCGLSSEIVDHFISTGFKPAAVWRSWSQKNDCDCRPMTLRHQVSLILRFGWLVDLDQERAR
jgi:hypothetical protein